MNLREQISKLQHEQWSGWMQYLFSKCTFLQEGCAVIPAWAVERWQRQIRTPYDALSNEERDSDREEADKILSLPVEIEEKCPKCMGRKRILDPRINDEDDRLDYVDCPNCQIHNVSVGTIRRPVTWQELIDMAKEGKVVISE